MQGFSFIRYGKNNDKVVWLLVFRDVMGLLSLGTRATKIDNGIRFRKVYGH